jgi:hypothetical protein
MRGAYERSRLFDGLRTSLLVVPMVLAAVLGGCGRPEMSVALGAALAAVVCLLTWRGGSAGRAVIPGLVAGTASLVFPLFACRALERAGMGVTLMIAACSAGGLVAGLIVSRFAARTSRDRARFLFACGAIATLAGSLGCIDAGLGGIAAMAVSLAIVSPLGLRRVAHPM